MTVSEIVSELQNCGYSNNAAVTQQSLFTKIKRNQLFSNNNRLNAGWGRGKIIIATHEDHDTATLNDYLKGWVDLVSKYNDQFLIIEEPIGSWSIYDAQGLKLGDENDVLSFIKKMTVKPQGLGLDVNPDSLMAMFAEYLKNLGKSSSTIQRYVYQAPKKKEIQNELFARCGTTNLYETTDIGTLIIIKKTVASSKYDQVGQRMYSCAIEAYIHFLANFKLLSNMNTTKIVDFTPPKGPRQLIYFGAPGTSKSTSIKKEADDKGKEVHRITFHPDTDYSSFVGCYKPTKTDDDSELTYAFVPQTFIKAYVSAWKKLYDDGEKDKEVFLVIEEINRGNCAQIFGDLFQLLDRNGNGYSDYEIEPDTDIERHLAIKFKDTNVPDSVKSGKKMLLPPNLYIWATMNTSDQSLFPIDSAFKRRWDWKYLPIKDEKKGHVIRIGNKTYDWYGFLSIVNERIGKLTESEDKQLGYWFAHPENGVEISIDTFVSKVVFYLWNDVFKDFGRDANSPFTIKLDDDKKEYLRFRNFFDENGNIKEAVAATFIEKLGVKGIDVVAAAPTGTQDDGSNEADTYNSDDESQDSEDIVSEPEPDYEAQESNESLELEVNDADNMENGEHTGGAPKTPDINDQVVDDLTSFFDNMQS